MIKRSYNFFVNFYRNFPNPPAVYRTSRSSLLPHQINQIIIGTAKIYVINVKIKIYMCTNTEFRLPSRTCRSPNPRFSDSHTICRYKVGIGNPRRPVRLMR